MTVTDTIFSRARRGRTPLLVATALLAALWPSVPCRAQDAAPALSAEDAVAAALANEPRLKAAEERWQAAHARRVNAEWNRLGKLETSFLYTPSQRPLEIDFPGIPPIVPPQSFEVKQIDRYSLSATLTQPLWTWGALSNERASARRDERANHGSFLRTRQETSFNARQSFLQASTAAAGVDVAQESLKQQRAFLDLAKAREEAGAAPHLDVLKAELAVARAEAELSQARHADRLAREMLVTVTMDERFRGAPLKTPEVRSDSLPGEEDAVAQAQRQRPDLLALGDQADALKFGAKATAAAARPALALRASITQQNDVARDVFKKQNQMYMAGVAVSWEAFGLLRTHSKVAELKANERAARQTQRAAFEAVALDVRSALLAAREARERVGVEEHALTVAEEQARVARLAYREGLITSVEAQDAELALTAARFDLLRARHDGAVADSRLRLALGE